MSYRFKATFFILSVVAVFILAQFFRADFKEAETLKKSPDEIKLTAVTSSSIKDRISQSNKASFVNVWATWCEPCIAEFPDLIKLRENYKNMGLELYLVSADSLKIKNEVIDFLNAQEVTFETYIKDEEDNQFMKGLSEKWAGALPVSLIYNKSGELISVHNGISSYEQMEDFANKALGAEL
jgi:thiol-disulfide isomerase/thioredoxin